MDRDNQVDNFSADKYKMNLTRNQKIIGSVGAIISGWLLNAFAWTTKLGHPTSTISLLLGLGLFFTGLIFLIVTLSKPTVKKEK
jgi:hypothetical protein